MKATVALLMILALFGFAAGQTLTIRTEAGGALPEGLQGLSASLGGVRGLAVDAEGSVYIAASYYNVVLKLGTNGLLTRVAGTGSRGYSGDGGSATGAQLNAPGNLAIDAAGNLYIADASNNRIRKVTGGVITTVAGNGTAGYGGDGGPATDAQLYSPSGIAIDAAGSLYVADTANNCIRKVAGGVITTVAGTGTAGFGGDGGPATSALLRTPTSVAVDSAGSLYIADINNSRVRKVSGGIITTVAGNGSQGTGGDGGLATSAQLRAPWGVAVDSSGFLYISQSADHRIRKVAGGVITTLAGDGTARYGGDGGPPASAQVNNPMGLATDAFGSLYIADTNNSRVRKVSSGTIVTIAGGGNSIGDAGSATGAQLGTPQGIAFDSAGSMYISEYGDQRIRKVSNGVITTFAGNGTGGYSGDAGAAALAQVTNPWGLAIDSAGTLYISDSGNQRVRQVSYGIITTAAGNGTQGIGGDSGPATSAQVQYPRGIATDAPGSLYIAQSVNNRVRKVTSGVISTIVGTSGTAGYSGDGGLALGAQLYNPYGVATDAAGNLYIADTANHRIRKVTGGVSTGVITTVAGNGSAGFSGDNGLAVNAQLSSPYAVAVDQAGDLYIADYANHRIRKVSNGIITTVAGIGIAGYSGDDGPATSAQLSYPAGLAFDAAGRLHIVDGGNNRIRVLTPGTDSCGYSISSKDLGLAAAGGTATLSIHTGAACFWSLSGLPAWLTVSGSSWGTGSGEVTVMADANSSGMRTASLSVGGVSAPIRQLDTASCASASCTIRALPHLAFAEQWTTGLSAVSSAAQTGNFAISFYNDAGTGISLPFTGGLGNRSTLTDSVPAQGMRYYEAENPGAPLQAGWGLVTADASVTVHAIFRRHTSEGDFYEAAVPASEGYSAFVMPFDATTFTAASEQMYTGFAIVNLNPISSAHVTCTARNQSGSVIPNAVTIPVLAPLGHYVNYLFPALTGVRGTFDCTADTLVAAIGVRAIGSSAFSTLPVIVK